MPHILIIDDEAWIVNRLATRLEQDGHRVATYTGGEVVEASNLIKKLHPDLVVLEYRHRNDYNELELLHVLRNDPRLAQLRIILVAQKKP